MTGKPEAEASHVCRTALVVLLLLAPSHAVASSMDGLTELDRRVVDLVERIEEDPGSPTAVLDVIAMGMLWDLTTPGLLEEQIERLSSNKKLSPEAALRVRRLEWEILEHAGDIAGMHEAVGQDGFVQEWWIVGPFDNENRQGHDEVFGPEEDMSDPFSIGLGYTGDERPVSWRRVEARHVSGSLYFSNFLYPSTKVCAYAGTYLETAKKRDVVVWGASGGTMKMWIDGEVVLDDEAHRRLDIDRHAARVKLSGGTHKVLVKVCTDSGPWSLVARFTDTKGRPIPDLSTPEPDGTWSAPEDPPPFDPFPHAFADLIEAHDADPEDPGALADLARYMLLTHSDDLTETIAGDLAQKAASSTGTCEDLILLARTTDDAHIGLNALKTCTVQDPSNAEAAYLYALAMKTSMGTPDFQNHIRALAKRFPDDLHIQLLWLQHWEDSGMQATALVRIEEMRETFGDVPALLRGTEYLVAEVQSAEQARKWKERLLEIRADETDARRDLALEAMGLGHRDEAMAHMEKLLAPDPHHLGNLGWVAMQFMALGDVERAGSILASTTEINPHNPFLWHRLAKFYKLTGEDDLALSCFQTVLDLEPSNVEVREYLAHLFPKSKFETDYIVDAETVRSMNQALVEESDDPSPARDIEGYDVTLLVSQEVDRVYGNGMSARFVQESIRINSEKGKKQFRYIPIRVSPSREDLDIIAARVLRADGSIEEAVDRYAFPIFDPDVRIYYDDVQVVIEMPPLSEGDIVDVQYKVSDATPRNMWERHFGNLIPVRSFVPVILFRYALITPDDLDVKVWVSPGAGLEESTQTREPDGQDAEPTIARTWRGEDLPAIEKEPRMPPMTELTPLIKVSTFESWEQFGEWWWGLSSQQMVADKTIKDKVAELVEGKETEEEKVEAIFDWVIRSTRYIALEFGVHGYKPYASPLVVSRGFGDCKDKATLLYVAMREAGLESAVALVRTRGSGEIGSDFPFQFQFDHAIAYSPGLDRFMDGTVDYVGSNTLPRADQDIFALVIGPDSVSPMRTPRGIWKENRQDVIVAFRLDAQGNAHLEGQAIVRGMGKAWYRSAYQSEATREERLEDEFSSIFPGLTIIGYSFEGLDDYAEDVVIDLEAEIPNFALSDAGDIQFAVLPSHGLSQSYASLSSRTHDVVVGGPRLVVDTYTYEVPEGFEFVELPPDVTLGSEGDPWWFTMTSRKVSDRKIELVSTLGFDTYRVDVSSYDAFRDFCKKVDDAMSQRAHTMEVTK